MFFNVADLVSLYCWNMGHVLGYVVLGMTAREERAMKFNEVYP